MVGKKRPATAPIAKGLESKKAAPIIGKKGAAGPADKKKIGAAAIKKVEKVVKGATPIKKDAKASAKKTPVAEGKKSANSIKKPTASVTKKSPQKSHTPAKQEVPITIAPIHEVAPPVEARVEPVKMIEEVLVQEYIVAPVDQVVHMDIPASEEIEEERPEDEPAAEVEEEAHEELEEENPELG